MNFEQALRLAGLRPRSIVPDGKIRRCATETHPMRRNGWYVLHPDGHGVYGDWATGSGSPTGTWRDENAQARPVDMGRVEAIRAAERAQRAAAIAGARDFWNRRCRPMTNLHAYLANKGLTPEGTTGLRITRDDCPVEAKLVVPVRWSGRITSVQTIDAGGRKLFFKHAPVKAGCHILERHRAAVTVFVEGLATGLAVYQSLRMARVVVAFDAGNLLPVIQALKPHGSVVIAADNDWKTQERRGFNPGIEKARNAAELIGCGVAYPDGIDGSDWADALKEWGERATKRIEREILGRAAYVEAS